MVSFSHVSDKKTEVLSSTTNLLGRLDSAGWEYDSFNPVWQDPHQPKWTMAGNEWKIQVKVGATSVKTVGSVRRNMGVKECK